MLDQLRPLLRTNRFGRRAEFYAAIDSTNRRAIELAAEGAPAGTVVITDHQTAGRGRHGRSWNDEPGLNLLLSVLLRPRLAPEHFGLMTLAAGVAVAEAVEAFTAPLAPALKWPNDVLLEGRKTCGMLLEAKHAAGEPPAVVLGIGLNVNQVDFPAPLADTATSLHLATGRTVPRLELLATLLERLEHWDDRLAAGGAADVRSAFVRQMTGLGDEATVALLDGRSLTGTVQGLAPDGALLLRTASGVRRLHAGDVTFRASAGVSP
jgi:BirA family transcriptional regulator, biotin operon repressor / biotin---[acetyl-CoA-carboxylase] ligase